MAHIDQLIPDVYKLLGTSGWFTESLATEFSHEVAKRVQAQFETNTSKPTLRLSKMGPVCPCALWHSIHTPDEAEPLPPWAKFKYTYGHLIEALAITLAKAAGHKVEGEQDEVLVDGIRGHRDCVIDGCIVDVKSSSSFGFKKFRDKTIANDDPFGYLAQLDGYLVGSYDDPVVTVKDRAYLWGIDKTLGHMCLYEHFGREQSIRNRIKEYREIVGRSSAPPCECGVIPDGKSGNFRLDTKASYNAFKHCCFPNLRTFLYSDGPRYLTRVARLPDITEVDRHGKYIYH